MTRLLPALAAAAAAENANATRKTHARLDRPARLEALARTEHPVKTARPVPRAKITHPVPVAALRRSLARLRRPVKDHPVHLDRQDPPDRKDHLARLAKLELAVALDQQARPARLDQLEEMANLDRKDHLARMQLAARERKVRKARPVQPDHPDRKDHLERLLPAPAALDQQAHLDHLDLADRTVRLASRDQPDQLATPVPTLNIVHARLAAAWPAVAALSLYFAISINSRLETRPIDSKQPPVSTAASSFTYVF